MAGDDNGNKTNHELALEIQQLRQFCLVLLLAIRCEQKPTPLNPYPSPPGMLGIACDHWWEKLGSYQPVEP